MPANLFIDPLFSIIIPVKEINDYVKETIGKIQELDESCWEVLLLPNEDAENLWALDRRITIRPTGRVGPADKRDFGSGLANGEYLVFFDDDSYPRSDYLNVALKYFEAHSVSAIGGPGITPKSDSFWQKVSGAVFLSALTGGAPERYLSLGKSRRVDDWPSVNFIVKKNIFMAVGGFDCPYWPGEDTRLCLKLFKGDFAIDYVPNLIVWHHRRAGLLAHLKQVGAYGLHRGFFAKKYPETSFRLKYFLPSGFFLFALISMPILFSGDHLLALSIKLFFTIYLCGLAVGIVQLTRYEGLVVAFSATPYIVMTHLVYGYQFIRGFFFTKILKSKLR
ncbi:glycosyltransferase [Polynucleobacter wuianus]|uniref:glycosyltransferase n=1 Tax=Polynucleobacter wuianus TaxID=1743168 RepID=UPI001C0E2F22|nr:glycosyltransferase [Polynucleobacter wuianus]MBU3610985.1 glycosyltransferase [Polynucleobacter wuianus]